MMMNNEHKTKNRSGIGPWGFPQPIAGGAFDSNLLLFYDAAFNGTSASGTGAAHTTSGETVGRSLSRNTYATLVVQTPQSTQGVLTATVKLSLDGTNFDFTLATIQLGNDAHALSGIISVPCNFQSFPWQKYDATKLKVLCTVADGDNDGASAWGKVSVYLGGQEELIYGRAPGAAEYQLTRGV